MLSTRDLGTQREARLGGSQGKPSSKALARTWPYPRHRDYEAQLQASAAAWFQARGYQTHSKYPYCLAGCADWPKNIILPEVAALIAAERAKREQAGEGFPFHKYIHHGLSSQARVFNLVEPRVADREVFADDCGTDPRS